jgi:hypothetical protein
MHFEGALCVFLLQEINTNASEARMIKLNMLYAAPAITKKRFTEHHSGTLSVGNTK